MAERLCPQILIRTHAPPDHEIGYVHYEHSKTRSKCIMIELWKLDEKKSQKSTDNINLLPLPSPPPKKNLLTT